MVVINTPTTPIDRRMRILYFHRVGGELLYKQLREIKGMENLGVGIDMLPSNTTSETLAAAAKAVEQLKKEKEKAKKNKERRDTKLPLGGRGQPPGWKTRGGGRGRGSGMWRPNQGGNGWDVVRHYNPNAHGGWIGGGNQGYHSHS